MADRTVSTDPADALDAASSFRVADWRVEPDRLRICRADSEVRLEPKVMRVLLYMAGRPGEVISREEREANVWAGRVVGYDAVANPIIKLRKAYADDARHPRIIETIPKTGYRLIVRVERSVPEPDQPAHRSAQGAGGERSAVSIYRRAYSPDPGASSAPRNGHLVAAARRGSAAKPGSARGGRPSPISRPSPSCRF